MNNANKVYIIATTLPFLYIDKYIIYISRIKYIEIYLFNNE